MCNQLKEQFHQETGQDQVSNQDTNQETLQNANQEQLTDQDQNQNSIQEQNLEQIFKDKNVGISTLQLVVNNNIQPNEQVPQWEGSIIGRVFDSGNTKGLVNKRIDVFFSSTAGYPVASLYTDEMGAYKVSELPPGFYTLRVYSEDHSFSPTDVVNIKVIPKIPTNQDILISTPVYESRKVRF